LLPTRSNIKDFFPYPVWKKKYLICAGVKGTLKSCVALAGARQSGTGFRQRLPGRRQIEVHLLSAGDQFLGRLAALHRREMASLKGAFAVPLILDQD
jgi:hypothetical protein